MPSRGEQHQHSGERPWCRKKKVKKINKYEIEEITVKEHMDNLWVAQAVIDEGESRLVPDPEFPSEYLDQDIDTTVAMALGDTHAEDLGISYGSVTKRIRDIVFQDYYDTMLQGNQPIEEGVWSRFHDTVANEIALCAAGQKEELWESTASQHTPEYFAAVLKVVSDQVISGVFQRGIKGVFIAAHVELLFRGTKAGV